MKISKAGDGVRFEYRFDKQYVRRVVSLQELTEFLEGRRREESNLADGKLPELFGKFATEKYLARCARPRLKQNSFEREEDCVTSLVKYFGEIELHKIDLEAWETFKTGRLAGTLSFSKKRCANTTVDKEFDCLKRALNYGVEFGLIKRNPLISVKGLKGGSRKEIWLRLHEIERLLGCWVMSNLEV